MEQIGFGGSCHWCTEAIFQSFRGVIEVRQGWIASTGEAAGFSEAVLVAFDPQLISLAILIEVHLHSHSCTSEHSLRAKYRSAIYTFNSQQENAAQQIINELQSEFDQLIITKVLPFDQFRLNQENYLNYYYNDPNRPFCQNIVSPKLNALRRRFGDVMR